MEFVLAAALLWVLDWLYTQYSDEMNRRDSMSDEEKAEEQW